MQKIVLIIIHGSKEHSLRYKNFQEILLQNEVDSFTFDLYDHGINLKQAYHHFSFNQILEATLNSIDEAKEKYPNHKQVIFSHSMGTFIAKYIVYKNLRVFDAAIFSGTNQPSKFLLSFGDILTNLERNNKVNRVNDFLMYRTLSIKSKLKGYSYNWMSSDLNSIELFKNDPLCNKYYSNLGLNAIFKFMKYSQEKETLTKFENKEMKQLFLIGGKDPVPNFGKDLKKLLKQQHKLGIINQQVIKYPEGKHEIIFELEAPVKDIIEFLEKI